MRRDTSGNHRTCTNHGASANSEYSPGTAHEHGIGSYKGSLFNDYSARSARVRDYDRPDADLCVIVDFDVLRILVVQIDTVTYENVMADLHSSRTVQPGAQCG